MTTISLGGGAEFDRIRAIARRLGARAAPLGDDCALVELGETTLALSTDVSVEGVHFRRDWLTLPEIGWRATAAALSDLAATGASAIGVLAALSVPAAEPAESFADLMAGVGEAVAAAGGAVLGGDLSRADALSLAITVVGRAERPVHRHGASPGNRLWITGRVGGARAALAAWLDGRSPASGARERFARPEARLAAGMWLASHGAVAMLDLSDGLAGDAPHLAAASGVALRIELGDLPLHPSVLEEARRAGESPAGFAARGGEDYELLVAMPAEFTGEPGVELACIGAVERGSGVRFLEDGSELRLTGYDHFA